MKNANSLILWILIAAFISFACLWDRDTIEMERQHFPDNYELIIGKFLRHSPEFYQWRIQNRENQVKNTPDSVRLYDDLAVAYSKLHDNKKAIKLMQIKDSILPNLYETYANLGTFYLHNGQFREGLKYIDRAIKLNPDAHFGREIYQKYVVEYILQKFPDGKVKLPLNKEVCFCFETDEKCINFYGFLLHKYNKKQKQKQFNLPYQDFEKALKGIQGMMKFGNYDSPILLEVLGDLLISVPSKEQRKRSDYEPARHLAARAYLKASKEAKNEETKGIYLQKARNSLCIVQEYDDGNKEMKKEYEKKMITSLEKGINEGEQFYQAIRNNEIKWIKQGLDPEQKFDEVYYKKAKANKVDDITQSEFQEVEKVEVKKSEKVVAEKTYMSLLFLFAFLVVAVIFFYVYKRFNR